MVPFFTMPILTRYLSPEQYGLIAIYVVYTAIIGSLVGVSTLTAFTKIYYDEKYLLVTPDIVTGVMTGLFFLAVGVLGLCCLGDIQGPGSFVNQNPTVGKEA